MIGLDKRKFRAWLVQQGEEIINLEGSDRSSTCPMAQYLWKCGYSNVWVGNTIAVIDWTTHRLPKWATEFIDRSDELCLGEPRRLVLKTGTELAAMLDAI